MAGQPSTWTGYWAAATVVGLMPVAAGVGSNLITPTSYPLDLADFQTIIDEVSAEFDQAAAKAGYSVPIPSTATSAYTSAQRIVRQGSFSEALRAFLTIDPKRVDPYTTAYQAALKAVAGGDLPLPGAPYDPSATNRLLPIWDGVASAVFTPTMGSVEGLDIPTDF